MRYIKPPSQPASHSKPQSSSFGPWKRMTSRSYCECSTSLGSHQYDQDHPSEYQRTSLPSVPFVDWIRLIPERHSPHLDNMLEVIFTQLFQEDLGGPTETPWVSLSVMIFTSLGLRSCQRVSKVIHRGLLWMWVSGPLLHRPPEYTPVSSL